MITLRKNTLVPRLALVAAAALAFGAGCGDDDPTPATDTGIGADADGGMEGDADGGMEGDADGGMEGDADGGMEGDADGGMEGDADGGVLPDTDGGTEPDVMDDTGTLSSIAEIAVATESLSTLVVALEAADLVDTLSGAGTFTVFAPTNDAFDALPEGVLDAVLADTDMLTDILLYHVAGEILEAADVVELTELTMLNGDVAPIVVDGTTVTIAGATITATDIVASNGVVHLIDAVMLPPEDPGLGTIPEEAGLLGNFTTLLAAVDAADLTDTLSGTDAFTVFAPTDAAFAALPEGTVDALLADVPALTQVLLYHVLSGSVDSATAVTLDSATTVQGEDIQLAVIDGELVLNNSATVVAADVPASNGVIHAIDAVLLPPSTTTIPAVASIYGSFSTLLAAVEAADLAGTLSGTDEFTVFAPTDAAFAALPAGTVDALLADVPALTQVLLYHVLSGSVDSATAVTLDSATTVQGEDIQLAVIGGNLVLNNSATVIAADVAASNGVIHVIDAVLLPPSTTTIPAVASIYGSFSTLLAAVEAADLAGTLSGTDEYTVFAPTDAAFAALPEGTVDALLADVPTLTQVLLYHVLAGSVDSATAVTLDSAATAQGEDIQLAVIDGELVLNNSATVVLADVAASNGVIHVIDAVLLPPSTTPIPAVADIYGIFSTLLAAVEAADLTATLSGTDEYTVFAPTNDAFAALPAGTVDGLLADIPALTAVLLYHVVAGSVDAATVAGLTEVTTLNGAVAPLTFDGGGIQIAGAPILLTDIAASNGLIHVIGGVMLPPPAP